MTVYTKSSFRIGGSSEGSGWPGTTASNRLHPVPATGPRGRARHLTDAASAAVQIRVFCSCPRRPLCRCRHPLAQPRERGSVELADQPGQAADRGAGTRLTRRSRGQCCACSTSSSMRGTAETSTWRPRRSVSPYRTLRRDSRSADTPWTTVHSGTAPGVPGAWFPPPIWAATVPAGVASAIVVPGPGLASRRRCRTGPLSPTGVPDPVGGRLCRGSGGRAPGCVRPAGGGRGRRRTPAPATRGGRSSRRAG